MKHENVDVYVLEVGIRQGKSSAEMLVNSSKFRRSGTSTKSSALHLTSVK